MNNELHTRMYGDAYGNHVGNRQYEDMTTATALSRKVAPVTETPAQRRVRWANMTPKQIIRATPIADLQKFARRGSEMAATELKRRGEQAARALQIPRPDPPLDLGV